MKIMMNHKTFEKVGNRWELLDDFGTTEISLEVYQNLQNEKWKGDRRQYNYTCIGYVMEKLTNTQTAIGMKSVRMFDFIQ